MPFTCLHSLVPCKNLNCVKLKKKQKEADSQTEQCDQRSCLNDIEREHNCSAPVSGEDSNLTTLGKRRTAWDEVEKVKEADSRYTLSGSHHQINQRDAKWSEREVNKMDRSLQSNDNLPVSAK